jgi:alkylhydroperoxidase family enzyme
VPSTFRIPRAEITGLYGRVLTAYTRRTWGQVPEPAYVYWHNRRVLRSVFGFERRVARWKALDPHLKTYAEMASAATIGCSWCMDFGYFVAHTDGLDESKVREVPRWRESDVFTAVERQVLAYAEAMSATPMMVTDDMVHDLLAALGPAAMVELTQIIAVENSRSRFNKAAGLASQGFSDVCELPLTTPASATAG